MGQSLASLNFHLVFSTKNREPFITADLQPRLFAYLGGMLREHKGCLLAAGGMPDHVHLLASLHRETSVSEVLRLLKSNSSGWIHETFPDLRAFAWQAGYGAFSVSYANLAQVKRYLAGQEKHHKTRTFQDEFRDFLKRHNIDYDERYVWD